MARSPIPTNLHRASGKKLALVGLIAVSGALTRGAKDPVQRSGSTAQLPERCWQTDLETPEGSIGTPLDNAIGYACWHVARLLVQRGAKVDKLWHAAALGLLDRLDELFGGPCGTEPEDVSQAFWHACAAGQRRAAELLLNRGADLNWVPDYAQGTPLDAAGGLGTRQNNVIGWLRDQGAQSSEQSK